MATRFVVIELDRPRRLRFDANALADLEGVMGMGLGRMMADDQMGIRTLRAMLWAGLKWEDRGLTLERAGRLIMQYVEQGGSLPVLGVKMKDAMIAAGWMKAAPLTEEEEAEAAEEPAPEDEEGNAKGA